MRSLVRILPGPYIYAMHLHICFFVTDFDRNNTLIFSYLHKAKHSRLLLHHVRFCHRLQFSQHSIQVRGGTETKGNCTALDKIEQDVFVKHYCPTNGHFLRNVTLIFDLALDDMTLTSWVLSKATCIPNMSIVT